MRETGQHPRAFIHALPHTVMQDMTNHSISVTVNFQRAQELTCTCSVTLKKMDAICDLELHSYTVVWQTNPPKS